jgi:hypothetical protein
MYLAPTRTLPNHVISIRRFCTGAYSINDSDCAQDSQILQNLHIYPLKWQADVREAGAELTFCVGGKPG